jgi:hypothetical protein
MKTKRRNVVGKRFVTMVKRFTVEITRPCVRAGYYGGETVLSAGKEHFFYLGHFMAAFPGVDALEDGDEVEVTIAMKKK